MEALGFLCASPCVAGTASMLRAVNTITVCAVYLAAQKVFIVGRKDEKGEEG